MEKMLLSLKNIYKIMMTNDFPIYSESVISEKNRKGQTLLRFWQSQLADEFHSLPVGKMLWRNDGKRNRYVSNLCNRSLEQKLCAVYANELSQQINTLFLMNQIERFTSFLSVRTYRHDVLLRRISELLRICEIDDNRFPKRLAEDLRRSMKECKERSGPDNLFQAGYLLTLLTIYAAAGDAMDEPGLSVLQDEAYSMEQLWKQYKQQESACVDNVTFLSIHAGILQDNPLPPHRFFGREEELFDLQEIAGSNRKCLVSGIGGVGKTELLRQLLRLCSEKKLVDKIAVIPFDVGITESFLRAFPAYQTDTLESGFRMILHMLERHITAGKRLLILIDNLNYSTEEDPCIQELLRIPCSMLVTSRCRSLPGFETYQIEEIPGSAGALIFRDNYGKALQQCDRDALNEMLQNPLICHPLTLQLMARAAAINDWCVEYLAQQMRENTVGLTWTEENRLQSLGRIYRQLYSHVMLPDNCRELVDLFTILPRKSYSVDFLTRVFPYLSKDIQEKLEILNQGGWVDMDIQGYSMHPLVAQCLRRKNITEEHVTRALMEIRRNLPEIVICDENVSYDTEILRICEIMTYMAELLAGRISRELLLDIMKAVSMQKWTHNAKEKWKDILNQLVKRCLQQDDLVEVQHLTVFGNWFFVDAEQIERVFRKQKEQMTVPQHQFYSLCLANAPTLAYEKPALAEEMLQEVLRGGALPEQIALTCYHMAALRYHEGDSEGAIHWSRKGVEYASAHPECGESFYQMNLFHLCMQYLRKGALEDARPVLEQIGKMLSQDSLPIQRMKYADMRAMWALNSGKPEEALEYYSKNAQLIREYRGEDVNYYSTRVGIGRALGAMKRFDEAMTHLYAARDYFRADGDDYYYAIVSLNIARLCLEQKQPRQALSALKGIPDATGKVPPQMQADILSRQAEAWRQLKDRNQEKMLLTQVLTLYQENGLGDSPQCREALQRLADMEETDIPTEKENREED